MAGSRWTATPSNAPSARLPCNAKNALFAGHDAGAQNWAMIASPIETCKLNGIEPHAHLSGVLPTIVNGHKQKDIEQLLP